MLTINDLADRLGLSVPQTRRLLRSVDSVVQSGVSRGRSNQIRISTDVVGILDRARSLWIDSGLTLDDLPDALSAELNSDNPASDGASRLSSSHEGDLPEGWRRYVEHLEAELTKRDRERDRLLAMLEGRDEQIRALMPGRSEDHVPAPEGGNGRMGRLQALRYAVFGR